MNDPKVKIAIFLALTVLFSSVFWIPVIRAGNITIGGGLYVLGLMWSPGLAAIVTRLVTQRNLRGMGWKPRTWALLGVAYALPLLYALPVYLVAWGADLGAFAPSKWQVQPGLTPVTGVLLIATAGLIGMIISATGEEIGWRGLLVPELAKITGFRNVALISGVIWAAWHVPLIVGANYRAAETPLVFGLACFTIMVVALSFLLAWITLRSGSFWPAALMHAAHNLFVQSVFDYATEDTAKTNWLTGEFGIGLALTIALAAWMLIRRSAAPLSGDIGSSREPNYRTARPDDHHA
jgi:membrane protease YdiL (CAAX protease family)